MSVNKIIKEYKRVYNLFKRQGLSRETVLFTDSKGFSVDKVVPDSVRDKFHIVAKSGTTATTDEHLINLFAKLEELKLKDPIILIWFGTCEITTKGKYIYLRNYPYQNIESILTGYRELRDKILARFKYVLIIFLECPYYSISTFNKTIREGKKNKGILDQNNNRTKPTNYSLVVKKYSGTRIVTKKERNKRHYPALVIDKTKGFRSVTQASSLDKELCYQVDYYNRQLKLLNKKYRAPRFSQDQIISNKPKNKTRVRYRKNYKLLSDGIHPNRTLAKLWVYEMVELSLEVSETC
ncbi:unnamed protein product [Mytilus coruscus]|uniref:Uncharacterized protein n=1 Tax=Mytilus coruscus TaxID=42192 RepID=A0A6J8EIK0_MYTCO|nr:unnamed protein product [Mytilus coruscus]